VPLLDDTANASDKYLNAAQVPGHSAIVHSIKGGSSLGFCSSLRL
jgi:hypothetical protein